MFTLKPPDLAPLDWSAGDASRLRRRFGDGFADAAEEVAAEIRVAAPTHTGELRDSVRVERDGDHTVIKAGGTPETTTVTRKGGVYDRAVLTEYGTGREAPEPFFYPAARGGRHVFDAAAANALKNPKGS